MDQAIECHVHPTWAQASPKVSINLKSENPEAGNQREPSRTLMPVINKVSPHLHCPAGSRPLWRSQASSRRLPAVILCHSSYQIPRNWYHYRPVTCAMHSFQSLYFSFASSFTCRSSRLCFITWKRLVEDYVALAFCIFHSLCWFLSVLEELVSLRG